MIAQRTLGCVLASCLAACGSSGGEARNDAGSSSSDGGGGPRDATVEVRDGALVVTEASMVWNGVGATADGRIVVAGAVLGDAGPTGARPVTLMLRGYDATLTERWTRVYGERTGAFSAIARVPGSTDFVVVGGLGDAVDLGLGALDYAGNEDVVLFRVSADGAPLWSRAFGGAGKEEVEVVGVDAMGQLYIAGTFEESANFGGETLEGDAAFIASYTSTGAHRWSRAFDLGRGNEPKSLQLDLSGRVHVFGANAQASFDTSTGAAVTLAPLPLAGLAGVDAEGNTLIALDVRSQTFGTQTFESWETRTCGPDPMAEYCEPIPTDGSPWLGYTGDGAIASFEGTTFRWLTLFPGPRDSKPNHILLDNDGRVVVTGEFTYWVDVGGARLSSAGPNDQDGFLAVLDPSGAPTAAGQLATPAMDGIRHVAHVAADTFVVVSGADGNASLHRVEL